MGDDFTRLLDLASRRLGGSVVYANDELFAERENLIKPEAPAYSTYTFGHKGQVYDGWETRRRREPGRDDAIVRLGVAGVVRGEVVPDPRFLATGALDLAALVNGGVVTGCSNMFYSSPTNHICPGDARVMGEGWETARRRDDGNDWVEFGLAGPGVVRLAELDTRYFVGNAPGWASLRARDGRGRGDDPGAWTELLPRTRLQPDTRHLF